MGQGVDRGVGAKASGGNDNGVHRTAGRRYRLSRPGCQRTGEQAAKEKDEAVRGGATQCLGSKLW